MKKEPRLLIINPGSTSSKIAVFEGESPILEKKIEYSIDDLNEFHGVSDQYQFRKDSILNVLDEQGINIHKFDGIVARGGLLKPISGGTYRVNDLMVKHLMEGYQGEHASNLGGIIAREIADQLDIHAYIVDPVVVDEMEEIAKVSGFAPIRRKSIFHALNQKAVARKAAHKIGKKYQESNLVVCHLGGGISVGAHQQGQVIDVNNALDGEGPFSPERSGGLPNGDLFKYAENYDCSWGELKRQIIGNGGLVSYLNTNDGKKVVQMIESGDQHAKLIYDAMIYQIAKEIGACVVTLKGELDAIVITGGLAHDDYLTNHLEAYVGFLGQVMIFAGEDEMKALAEGGLRVIKGVETAKEYV